MDASGSTGFTTLRVLAVGIDAALEAPLAEAAARANAAVESVRDEAEGRARLRAGDVDLAVVGGAWSAGAAVDAPALAARLAGAADTEDQAPPVLLCLASGAGLGTSDRLRLAAQGIEVIDAAGLDAEGLAQRFVLHARARDRAASGRRAQALLATQEALIAGLAHDLRTPLMAINLSAEVAGARSSDDSVLQAMRRIRSSTQRMARALDHLSNVARLDPAPVLDAVSATDLGELVHRALDEVRRDHPGSAVELVVHGDLRLHAQSDALQRVLVYLLAMAIEHAQGERVGVRVDGSTRDRLWFEVTTARVIPAEVQERLVGRPRERDGREQPGLALGLDAVQPIVQAHAGSVVGRSKAPEGTVFELLLPRARGTP